MLELPHVKARIEALLKGDAVFVPFGAPHDLDQEELIDSLLVPGQDLCWWKALDPLPQGVVAQILQDQNSFLNPMAV